MPSMLTAVTSKVDGPLCRSVPIMEHMALSKATPLCDRVPSVSLRWTRLGGKTW